MDHAKMEKEPWMRSVIDSVVLGFFSMLFDAAVFALRRRKSPAESK